VDSGLGEHAVVCESKSEECLETKVCSTRLTLELRLPERRSVASNDDELGLAGAQALKGGLVTKGDLAGLLYCQNPALH
jgi:hypothetical protein